MTAGNAPQPANEPLAEASAQPAAPPETPAEHRSVGSPAAPAHASHHTPIPEGFLERVRRNHVGRVALLYLAICWFILEPVHVVFHMLGVPEWVNRLVIVVLALGFPLTVILAWIYTPTPQDQKSEALAAHRSVLRRLNLRLNLAIAAVAGLMVLYFLLYHFWLGKHITEPVSEEAHEALAAQPVPSVAVPQRSIAVLPFLDMSQARDQQYLADGLAEELLNLLAQIPELRVAARTSSFAFKNKPGDVSTIAKDLHVAHVLEGSVRKAGNHVRITAQLIRADSGYHLWSETYDRTLDDIFKLQDQIAGAVVQALKVKLLGTTLPARAAPANSEAYNLYLQARFLAGAHTKEAVTKSIDYLERAVKLDKGYEPTWTELSIVYTDMAASGFMPAEQALPKAREAVSTAISLNPRSARAHVALGFLHMNDDWDWVAADREIGQALALAPGNADVLNAAAILDLTLGRVSDSVKLYLAAVERDPLHASAYSNLGVAYFSAGHLAEAERAFRKSIELRPAAIYMHNGLGLVLLWQGNASAALEEMKRETDEMWRLEGLAIVYSAMHRRAESDAALAELTNKFQKDSPYVIATVYGYRGEVDEAFRWLDEALVQRDATLTSIKSDPLFKKITSDPRYPELLQKVGLPL